MKKQQERVNLFIDYFSNHLPESKNRIKLYNAFELTVAVVLSTNVQIKE